MSRFQIRSSAGHSRCDPEGFWPVANEKLWLYCGSKPDFTDKADFIDTVDANLEVAVSQKRPAVRTGASVG
jgi:hypothetical protein